MSLEIRNPKSEIRNLSSALTPSELAALLGPCRADVIETPRTEAASTTTCWNGFAETFSRQLTTRLRTLLRAAVRVTFSGSQTLTAEALTTSEGPRTLVTLWQSDRSLEPVALSFSIPLVATFVDRLLGGHSAPNSGDADLHRPLTEVDHQLASRLMDAVRCSLGDPSESTSSLALTQLPRTSNSSTDAWFPDSSLVSLSFDLRLVQGGGTLELWLPIEVANTIVDVSEPRSTIETPDVASKRSLVVAQLGQALLSRHHLQSLAIGDILMMQARADQPVRLLVDGQLKFDGVAGRLAGHKAIQLTKAVAVRAS
jgi:flagellar motor switch protein FliM